MSIAAIKRHDLEEPIRLGVLVSHLRMEEKLILAAAKKRSIDVEPVFDRKLVLDICSNSTEVPESIDFDVVLDRSVAHSRAAYTLRAIERYGTPTLNTAASTDICDDKAYCSIALAQAGVLTPRTLVAYSIDTALQACEELGYPVVMKPVTGSWGRLLAKVNGPVQARAILDQKHHLGSFHHSIYYIQEYLEKPGRDIRVFVIGDQAVAAAYRASEHWITNTARGAQSIECSITPEIEAVSLHACRAVGAYLAGVDLVETADGYSVIEVNTGGEFHGLITTTERDIAGEIVEYAAKMGDKYRRNAALHDLLTPERVEA